MYLLILERTYHAAFPSNAMYDGYFLGHGCKIFRELSYMHESQDVLLNALEKMRQCELFNKPIINFHVFEKIA